MLRGINPPEGWDKSSDKMKEYDIVSQGDFHSRFTGGHASGWVKFGELPIVSGRLAVSDPMFFRDKPPPPTIDIAPGCYGVYVKTITYPDDRRVSRLRVQIGASGTFGPRLADVGVDFAQVSVFDPVVPAEAAENVDAAELERFYAEFETLYEYQVVRLSPEPQAVMPVASSGLGDGGYPIHELLHEGRRVGVEVVFIGPEVFAP